METGAGQNRREADCQLGATFDRKIAGCEVIGFGQANPVFETGGPFAVARLAQGSFYIEGSAVAGAEVLCGTKARTIIGSYQAEGSWVFGPIGSSTG